MTPADGGPRIELLPHGAAAYARMYRLIEDAREAVELETYIYRPGQVGDRIRQLLEAAATRGVRVRVLVDSLGSDTLPQGYFAALLAAGGEVRHFNPKRLLQLSFRNHRKLLCCDDTAIVGGMNIGDEYDGDGVEHGWRDLAVAIQAPVVRSLRASFERMWQLAAFGRRQFREFWLERPRRSVPESDGTQLLLSGPACPTAELRRQLVADIRASRRLWAWAAYFLPARRVGAAIRSLARRGDARVLLGAVSDLRMPRWASERLFSRFLRAGDNVVYIGSSNLDVRSLLINYELLLRIPSTRLAEELRARFEADLSHADEIDRRRWKLQRRWWQALRSRAAFLVLARLDPYVANRRLRSLK
jgi:cardiolipin synthase